DRLVGLESGADDYVCKPFTVRELVARVKTILRRGRGTALAHGLAIDETRHSAELDGKELNLTPVEFRLLGTLASAPGRVFSRDKLLQRLYEDHRVVTDRTVDAAAASKGEVAVIMNGLGTATPLRTVTVRSRVDGELMRVLFGEGQIVKQGQLLAEIDSRPFQVQLAQAEGQLVRDRALLENAHL